MRRATLMAILCLGAGCDGQTVNYTGFYMDDFFPFDGSERSWTYGSLDEEVNYRLLSDLDIEGAQTSEDQRYRVYTVSTRSECLPEVEECGAGWKHDIQIASSRNVGVTIHGYQIPGSDAVVFEEPFRLADAQMAPGDFRTTEDVDGHTWTTTFHGVSENCDQVMPVAWECAELELTSEPAGHWLTGTYWAAAGYNIVAFQRKDDTGKWRVTETPVYEP